jgi:pyruvate dehydrogenase E1 component alpha subunit
MTAEELVAFEREIAAEFNAGNIRAPIHLDGGNEQPLIQLFGDIKSTDWVFASWRSHYKALLHGVPPEKVKAEIMAGRSIAMCFPEHNFFSSAIVGGALPIALGVALSIRLLGGKERCHVFVGDMTARSGAFHECAQYAKGHDLPIQFIVENNGLSVCTPTEEVWGSKVGTLFSSLERYSDQMVAYYEYKLPFPHSGAGVRVQF